MTSIANGESGSSVRTKLNSSLAVTDAFTVSGSNVGIGTSPATKLEINDGTNTEFRVTTTASGYLQVGQFANGAFIGTSSADATAGVLRFGTSATERMRITSGGNVGIGTSSPNAASIVDAQSTTKGVRFPNMTTAQKALIANVAGNVVFDTTLGKLCVNSGSGWQTITSV